MSGRRTAARGVVSVLAVLGAVAVVAVMALVAFAFWVTSDLVPGPASAGRAAESERWQVPSDTRHPPRSPFRPGGPGRIGGGSRAGR